MIQISTKQNDFYSIELLIQPYIYFKANILETVFEIFTKYFSVGRNRIYKVSNNTPTFSIKHSAYIYCVINLDPIPIDLNYKLSRWTMASW